MEDEAGLGQTAMCHAPSCADQGGKMQDSMGLQSCSASFTKAMLEEEWYMAGAGDNSIMDDMKQLAYSASSPLQLPLPLTMPLSDGGHGGPSIFGQLDGPGTHFQPFLPPGRGMAAGFGRDDRSGSGMSLSSLLDGALTFDAAPGFIGGFSGGGGGGGYNAGGGSQLDVLADLQDGVQVGQSHVGVLSGFGMAGGNLMCGTAGNGLSPGRVHNVGMSNLSPRSPLGGHNGDGYGGSMNGGIGNMLTNGMGGGGFGGFGTPLSGNGGGYGDPFANSLMRSFGGKDGVVTSAMLLGGGVGGGGGGGGGGGSSDKLQQQHQLRPLGGGPPQTLFQKRAARLAAGSSSPSVKSGPRLLTANASPCDSSVVDMADQASPNVSHNKRKAQAPAPRVHDSLLDEFGMGGDPSDDFKDDDDLDESGDGSVMLYETASDEMLGLDGGCQGLMSSGGGGEKGKGKKGPPAKNLMAERRRRKKLNERLYNLRAVVPKITKMDRASILGDAIEHLRSLLQQIRDLHQELENPPERQLPPSPSGLLPSSSNLGCRVKEEFPTPLPSPDSQAARVQVVIREGRTLNIHMFCARRPGLLLSTMRALDGLGLDVQQAVISCFNGFALDVFRAEQLKEVEVGEDEIRRVLLRTAGCISSL